MCFHIALFSKKKELEDRYNAPFTFADFPPVHHRSGFEFKTLPVITNDQPYSIQPYHWGLIPQWAKDDSIRSHTLNARIETAFEKPSFKNPIRSQRCLIPCNGFYEWQQRGKKKFPYFIYLPERQIFSIAGIWDKWHYGTDSYHSFSLLTTQANPLLAKIHNVKKRMPAILSEVQESLWLSDDLKEQEVLNMCRPYKGEMEAYTVSRLISDRKRDSNQLAAHERFLYPELSPQKNRGGQLALFEE